MLRREGLLYSIYRRRKSNASLFPTRNIKQNCHILSTSVDRSILRDGIRMGYLPDSVPDSLRFSLEILWSIDNKHTKSALARGITPTNWYSISWGCYFFLLIISDKLSFFRRNRKILKKSNSTPYSFPPTATGTLLPPSVPAPTGTTATERLHPCLRETLTATSDKILSAMITRLKKRRLE